TTFAPYWSYEAVKFLHNNYHMNPKYQVKIHLKKKEHILIVDNHRMLHGRGEFAGNRKLRRVWLNDDDPIILKNVHDTYRNNRATMQYAPYIPLNMNNASKYKKINTGIRLDKSLYNKRKNVSFKSYHNFEFKEFSPVAILYQALQPPIIDGIRKPLKPGGYSDSGADIAYSLRSDNIPIVTP
ncbi:2728_t:CDS:1, partial [Gigaspora margarita]